MFNGNILFLKLTCTPLQYCICITVYINLCLRESEREREREEGREREREREREKGREREREREGGREKERKGERDDCLLARARQTTTCVLAVSLTGSILLAGISIDKFLVL